MVNLLHMFWPRAAHSAQLRELAARPQGTQRSLGRKNADVEADLGTLSMVCVSLVATLIQKGIISELEFQNVMATVDAIDTKGDLSLDPNAMRKALGLPPLKRRSLKSATSRPRGAPRPPRKR